MPSGVGKIHLQLFLDGERTRISLGKTVKPIDWDVVQQRVKGKTNEVKDLNLYLDVQHAKATAIAVEHRLANKVLTIDSFKLLFNTKGNRNDFITLADEIIDERKKDWKKRTYDRHVCTLNICKAYKKSWPINQIDGHFMSGFETWLSKTRAQNTRRKILGDVRSYMKRLKMPVEEIFAWVSRKQIPGQRESLDVWEKNALVEYYNREYILPAHRCVLQCFLFAMHTGLRYSDVKQISRKNIVDGRLTFYPEKAVTISNKSINFKLPNAAYLYINEGEHLFTKVHADMNKYLHQISKTLKLKTHVTFHIARHTFATNYLRAGGKVQNLQKVLGHAKIETTMVYVHLADIDTDVDIDLFNTYNSLGSKKVITAA